MTSAKPSNNCHGFDFTHSPHWRSWHAAPLCVRFCAIRYENVLLTDITAITDLAPEERFIQADLQNLSAMEELCGQVDAVVHLGGMVGAAYRFEDVLSRTSSALTTSLKPPCGRVSSVWCMPAATMSWVFRHGDHISITAARRDPMASMH